MTSLARRYRITESNLAARREFIRLGDEERRQIASLLPWAEEIALELAKDFYDHQFGFKPTLRFLSAMADRKGIPLVDLRRHLERTQSDYFVGIFRGARDGWDVRYFEARLRIGQVHDQIDLPMKWYIGSYADLQRSVIRYLPRSGHAPERLLQLAEIIFRVLNFDIQAVVDSYSLSLCSSMGIGTDALEPEHGSDRTECYGRLKAELGTLREQAMAIATDRFDDPVLGQRVNGELGAAFEQMHQTVRFMQRLIADVNRLTNGLVDGDLSIRIDEAPYAGRSRELQMVRDLNTATSAVDRALGEVAAATSEVESASQEIERARNAWHACPSTRALRCSRLPHRSAS